jgi:hypothetical protein
MLFLLALAACQPSADVRPLNFLGAYEVPPNYGEIFKAFWQGINTNYAYWEVERDDFGQGDYWDNVYKTYLPKFEALGDFDPTNVDDRTKAEEYFTAAVKNLHDGHFFLDGWLGGAGSGFTVSPQSLRVRERLAGRGVDRTTGLVRNANWDAGSSFTDTIKTYLSNEPLDVTVESVPITSTTLEVTSTTAGFYALVGTIKNTSTTPGGITGKLPAMQAKDSDGYVVYLGFNSFIFAERGYDSDAIKLLSAYTAKLVGKNCRGVIFDVRGNNGGYGIEVNAMLAPLLTSNLTFCYQRGRRGSGRYDFLPWKPRIIEASPAEGNNWVGVNARAENAGSIPVAAIVNDYSASCAEHLPLAVKALPDGLGMVVGTQTRGMFGGQLDGGIVGWPSSLTTGSGSFTVMLNTTDEQLLLVSESGEQVKGADGKNYDGVGITPDIIVEYSGNINTATTDNQLEETLAAINKYWETH